MSCRARPRCRYRVPLALWGLWALLWALGCGGQPAKDEKIAEADIPPTQKKQGQPDLPVDNPPPHNGGETKGGRMPDLIATFMGVEAKGRNFCIIADSSLSMNRAIVVVKGDKKTKKKKQTKITRLDYLKLELIKTLRDLKPGAKFNVTLFDKTPHPMPHADWLSAGPDVDKVADWIKTIPTHYGTVPYPAFVKAFALKPRPDVIFFMTDGEFALGTAARIAKLNAQEPKTVIHCIELHNRGAPGAKAKKAKKINKAIDYGALEDYLNTSFPGGKYPPAIQSWLAELRRDKVPLTAGYKHEAQMRVIAAQSGGTFRRVTVDPADAARK